jgi:ribonucleoside-diphosphate reductase alpha chain
MMFVTKRNGNIEDIQFDKITQRINKLIKPEEKQYLNPVLIAQKVVASIYSGITTEKLDNESANICINLCTTHYLYSTLAGRILISNLHKKTLNTFVEKQELIHEKLNIVDIKWLNWIKDNRIELNSIINYDNDYVFDYFGYKTLEKSYLIKINDEIIERPQDMILRVASFINQGNINMIKHTYNLMSNGYYIHASPTLFNSGNKRSQLASCFLLGVDDSLESIGKSWNDIAQISKWGGGIGIHVSNIRAKESLIKGTNGPSSGLIPMLKVYDQIVRYVDQGGKRKGSVAVYLEPYHPDILAFLELKKNFGSETERARDLFLAVWIPDLFMKAVEEDGDWYLMCPNKCPGLSDLYGADFEKLYNFYIIKNMYNEKVKARTIMQSIINSQLETGTPYITYKDHVNNKTNQKNIGTIKSSNLCVHEDTKILTDLGYIEIKKLENQIVNIWNGTVWSTVTVRKTGTNKNLLRIKFSNGVYLDCTEQHKFYIKNNINEQKSAIELNKNDILIPLILPKPLNYNKNIEFKYAYTHGLYCSDLLSRNNKIYLPYNKHLLISYIECKNYTYDNIRHEYIIELHEDINVKYDVPMYSSIKDRLKWFEGFCEIAGNVLNNILYLPSANYNFLLNIRLMLHTLGIESKITDDILIINNYNLYKLNKLGFKLLLHFFTIACIEENNEDIQVLSITNSYTNVDTYCFTEPLEHKGIFNGIITGQCNEILEYSDHNEYAVCNLASIAINKCIIPFEVNKPILIYTIENCKYCKWTKAYLQRHNIFFEENTDKLLKDVTYPQIYYGDELIGGYTEFMNYIRPTFDFELLYDIAYTSIFNLNNIIDINYYPVIETKLSNLKHRPIGLGIQGLADLLVSLKICFDSEEALEFNGKIMETIYLGAMTASHHISRNRYQYMNILIQFNKYNKLPEYYDINYSYVNNNINDLYHKLKPNKCELEKEESTLSGSYSTFEGSPISQGLFQFDMWNYDNDKLHYKDKWNELREQIKIYGVRNSLLTALMPTASTSQILGNNECFEFFTNNIYTRRTLAGDFPIVNKYLIDDLDNIGLWNSEMKDLIIANNGSIANIKIIPENIRNLYKNIWEIKQIWVLKNALARAPFVDQTQSMNIFLSVPDSKSLYSSHFWAWKNGLKTGIYYLRSKPAKEANKVTIDPNIQKKYEESICESCSA